MDTMEMNITYDLGGLAIYDSSTVNFENTQDTSKQLH